MGVRDGPACWMKRSGGPFQISNADAKRRPGARSFCLRRAGARHCKGGEIFRTQGPPTTLAHRSPHALMGTSNREHQRSFNPPIKAGGQKWPPRAVGPHGQGLITFTDPARPTAANKESRRLAKTPLMPEMAHAGEDHGHAAFIGGGDDLFIAHGATWLDQRGGARISGHVQTIGKRQEGFRRCSAALGPRGHPSQQPWRRPRPSSWPGGRCQCG